MFRERFFTSRIRTVQKMQHEPLLAKHDPAPPPLATKLPHITASVTWLSDCRGHPYYHFLDIEQGEQSTTTIPSNANQQNNRQLNEVTYILGCWIWHLQKSRNYQWLYTTAALLRGVFQKKNGKKMGGGSTRIPLSFFTVFNMGDPPTINVPKVLKCKINHNFYGGGPRLGKNSHIFPFFFC